MKIIYAVCSWGLGHATRSLPVIRKLVSENHELKIISQGRSLQLLKNELGDSLEYIELEDYPMLLSESPRQFMAKSMIYWPKFIGRLHNGFNYVKKLIEKEKIDRIISDARYDIYSRSIPSFFMSHQMRIMNPLRLKMLESGSEIFNLFFFKRYAGVIVPDYKEDNLSGDLSHNLRRIDENKLHYVGVLSDFEKKKKSKDIDYLISISGPEPQRTMLEEKIMSQVKDLKGKIVVTLGKTENLDKYNSEGIETYSFLPKNEREDFLNRSKLVISRSGYSTILDLSVVGAKALMTPTPGQIEQEYLGKYHNKKGSFYCLRQDKINLARDVEIAKKKTGIKRKCDVKKSVENILDVVYNTTERPLP